MADLKGANQHLAPFAVVAQEMGLTVTSGKRPGSITSSGNRSNHADGNALDVAGPPDKMRAFFDLMRERVGGKLEELIYSPAGAKQIKNGQAHLYTGQVVADHFDHVHIADTDGDAAKAITGQIKDEIKGSVGNVTGAVSDAAGAVGGAAAGIVGSIVSEIAKHGGRLLLEIALILGGSVLVLWGATLAAGTTPTAAATTVATRGTKR